MKIHILLIADEHWAKKIVAAHLECRFPEMAVVHQAECLEQGIQLIELLRPDLIILDGDILREDFFDYLEWTGADDIDIVIIARNDCPPRHAFRLNTIGFFLKPVEPDALIKAIQTFIWRQYKKAIMQQVIANGLTAQHDFPYASPVLSLSVSEGVLFIPVNDIWYIKADGPYSEVYYANNCMVKVSKPLKYLAARLQSGQFERVHSSYLVNLVCVEKIHRDGYLVLKNQHRISVSRANRQKVIVKLTGLTVG